MTVAANHAEVLARVEQAARRVGRQLRDIQVIAVSKFQPTQLIEEAYRAGLRDFAENYVQALSSRTSELSHLKDIRWHLIGHLQRNKVAEALRHTQFMHAIDSQKLLQELIKKKSSSARLNCFIEVNIDAETQKAGAAPAEVWDLVSAMTRATEAGIQLLGLMAVPRADSNEQERRASFRRLRALSDETMSRLKGEGCNQTLLLNMGMSGDFEWAIEEGAHWIRIGTILFGERPPRT